MVETSGANRIELECQVLSAALRTSWGSEDSAGRAKSCMQLSQLFPDLVTGFDPNQAVKPHDLYTLLGIDYDVAPRKVIIAYFRKAKKFLREHNPRQKRQDYYQLLDAGFMLRKPRLRLSHDMIVSRSQLIDLKIIQANGTFDMVVVPEVAAAAAAGMAPPVGAAPAQVGEPQVVSPPAVSPGVPQQAIPGPGQPGAPPPPSGAPPPPPPVRLPAVVELLRSARIIAGPEVQALTNQMRMFPGVSVVELILSAGYVTESEMKSVQLGEFLLGQGKINLGQFCVAMYDERTTGVKMADSLQNRGWLRGD